MKKLWIILVLIFVSLGTVTSLEGCRWWQPPAPPGLPPPPPIPVP